MSTPMVTNWKKIDASKQEAVDLVIAQFVLAQSPRQVDTKLA
jgi:hypothetical protein